jgi:hypothetical protein
MCILRDERTRHPFTVPSIPSGLVESMVDMVEANDAACARHAATLFLEPTHAINRQEKMMAHVHHKAQFIHIHLDGGIDGFKLGLRGPPGLFSRGRRGRRHPWADCAGLRGYLDSSVAGARRVRG